MARVLGHLDQLAHSLVRLGDIQLLYVDLCHSILSLVTPRYPDVHGHWRARATETETAGGLDGPEDRSYRN